MSLHAILEAIRASGEARVREIEAQAAAQARELLTNTGLEAQELREAACAAASAPAVRERARIIHRARLEGLRATGSVREALVDAAIDQTRGRLANLRSSPEYPEILRRLVQEALAEVGGSLGGAKGAQVEADPRDQEMLDGILIDLWLNLQVSYSLACWGGLVARSEDGRVVVINTLEARLERAGPYLRHALAVAFEDEVPYQTETIGTRVKSNG